MSPGQNSNPGRSPARPPSLIAVRYGLSGSPTVLMAWEDPAVRQIYLCRGPERRVRNPMRPSMNRARAIATNMFTRSQFDSAPTAVNHPGPDLCRPSLVR